MVNYSLRDLLYGHPGPLRYSHKRREWTFARNFDATHELLQLGAFRPLLEGTARLREEPTVHHAAGEDEDLYGRSLNRRIALLIRAYPELAPAHPLLSISHRVSEKVAAGLEKYDPAKGQLIAHGSVLAKYPQGVERFQVPLVAIPGGRCGEALRLVRLQRQPYGWEKEQHHLDFLGPGGEVGWWVGKGAPILQIRFTGPWDETGSSLLAIRLQATTVILEACYDQQPKPPAGVTMECTYPPSRIHAKPVFEVDHLVCKSTGSHADVTFNPWVCGQFAVVDECGQWAVFGLRNVHKNKRLRCHELLHSGCIRSRDWKERLEEDEPFYESDGWARILWAGISSTILICLRDQISTVDFRSGTLADVKLPDTMGLPRGVHLDCVRCPSHPSWIFLLTTDQIVWIEVSEVEDSTRVEPSQRATALLSTRHFRDQRDISLYLKVMDDDADVLVLVASRANEVMTCFRFAQLDGKYSTPGWASDPMLLKLPVSVKGSPSVLDFSISTVQHVVPENEEIWLPLEEDSFRPRFYSLQVLKRDFSISHAFIQSRPNKSYDYIYKQPKLLAQVPEPVASKDHFVITDGVSVEKIRFWDPLPKERPQFKVTYSKKVKELKKEQRMRGPTLNNEAIVRRICRSLNQGDTTLLAEDVLDITWDLQNLVLSRAEGLGLPALTLLEQIQSVPSVPDITKTGPAFSGLFETSVAGEFIEDPGLAVERLPLPSWTFDGHGSIEKLTFMDIYNRLLDRNLIHLNPMVHSRARIAKERAARSAAAEFMLASAGIKLVDATGPSTQDSIFSRQDAVAVAGPQLLSSQSIPSAQPSTSSQPFALPWHPPSPRKDKAEAIEEAARHLSPGLPTPSVSRSPSLASSSHLGSISHASFERGHAKRTLNAVKNRLSRYVEIRKPRTGRKARPIALLKHWGLGENPHSYDFRGSSRVIENARAEAGMSKREREALWRKKERHLQRQKRENEKFKRYEETRSSQLVVLPSSDPFVAGSSQVGGTQTQGKKKKKRKKRTEGF